MEASRVLLFLVLHSVSNHRAFSTLSTNDGRAWTPMPIPLHHQSFMHSSVSSSNEASPLVSFVTSLPNKSSSTIKNHPSSSSKSTPSQTPSAKGFQNDAEKSNSLHTKDRTYTVESTHFTTPIIQHHKNGATVGLDLPDSNIRLLLDLDQLGGKPVAQHIGLKVVERDNKKSKKSMKNSSSNYGPSKLRILKLGPIVSPSVSESASSASNRILFDSFRNSEPNSIENFREGLSVNRGNIINPVNKYKIGYIRTSDLHSAIKQQLASVRHGSKVGSSDTHKSQSIISSPFTAENGYNKGFPANTVATPGVGLRSPAAALQSSRNGRSHHALSSSSLDNGSFKPIEKYSAKLEVRSKPTNRSIDHQTATKDGEKTARSPVFNDLVKPIQKIRPVDMDGVKQEKIDSIDIGFGNGYGKQAVKWPINNEHSRQIVMSSKSSTSSSSSSSSSSQPLSTSSLQTDDENNRMNPALSSDFNDNSDVGFDDAPVENSDSAESLPDDNRPRDDPSRLSRPSRQSSLLSTGSAADSCPLSCISTCATNTEQLIDRDLFSLQAIAEQLEAEQIFELIPKAMETLQSMVDFAASGYTLFLPHNNAINRLPKSSISRWKENHMAMNEVLENHFLDSFQTLQDLEMAKTVSPRATDSQLRISKFQNQTYTINGRNILIGDQKGPNEGIIHVVDGLLYPTANQHIMKVLRSCRRFDGFVTLSEGTGISEILSQDGPFTLFVPSNEALQKIPEKDLQVVRTNMTALRDLLTYHVVNGVFYSHNLKDGQYLESLLRNSQVQVGVRVDGCSRRLVEANMSPVFKSDIPASNGVIHVVDWIIKPSDQDWCENVLLTR